MGIPLTAAYPLLLGIGIPLSAAFLFYVYRRRSKVSTIVVPTLFLLRKVAKPSLSRNWLTLPLRILLDALLLCALLALAAGLALQDRASTVAVVIDNSLSMGRRAAGGETLLATAKKEATEYLSSLPFTTAAQVYSTCPSLKPLQQKLGLPQELSSRLRDIPLCFESDGLDAAVRRSTLQGRVRLYTDREILPAVGTLPEGFSARSLAADEALKNIGFAEVERASDSLSITLRSSTLVDASGTVVLLPLSPQGEALEKGTAKKAYSFSQGEETTLSFPIQQDATFFELRLTIDGLEDSLPLDNNYWVSIKPKLPRVLLLSPFEVEELGLTKLADFSFRKIRGEEEIEAFENDPSVRGLLCHQCNALPTNRLPVTLIDPPAGSSLVKGSISARTLIASWQRAHPLTRYLSFSSLALSSGKILEPPPYLSTIVESTKGPVILAGSRKGNRVAVLGSELLPFAGEESPHSSILLLNALKWAFTNEQPITPHEAQRLERWKLLRGATLEYGRRGKGKLPPIPGIFKLTEKSQSRLVAQQFTNQEEAFQHQAPVQIPAQPRIVTKDSPAEVSLANYLIALLAALLLLDLAASFIPTLRLQRSR